MLEMPIENQGRDKSGPYTQNLTDEQAQQLLIVVRQYMPPAEVEQIVRALQLAQETCRGVRGERAIPPLEHALAVASILAQNHIDAVGVAAALVFEAIDADLLTLESVENTLGSPVARVVGSMLRMNILERKKHVGAQFIVPDRPQSEPGNGRESKKQR